VSKLLKQTRDSGPKRVLTPGPPPKLIVYETGGPNTVKFADGSSAVAACIGCEDRPCHRYSEEELAQSPLGGFPLDKAQQVCPTNVVSPDGAGGLPNIKADGCIMCGVCVARCPVGAIFIDSRKGAVVQTETNERFVEASKDQIREIEGTRAAFASVVRKGIMVQETDSVVETIGQRNERALAAITRYPDVLARNLLTTLGANAVMRRTGVTSMRMDILQQTVDGYPGIVEVEFGDEAVLDAPRDILDDVAVMVARHGWSRGKFHTAIITDLLPNRRSEYWRIVADIQRVTDVRVLTISMLSLMFAVWRQHKLTRSMCDLFYADEQTKSYLWDVVTKALGFNPHLTSGSSRLVDWVK
jgi:Fe-S-cluster-containing hydrogenase component 2